MELTVIERCGSPEYVWVQKAAREVPGKKIHPRQLNIKS